MPSLMSSEISDVTSTVSPLDRNRLDYLMAISEKSNSQFDTSVESELYDSKIYLRAVRRFLSGPGLG